MTTSIDQPNERRAKFARMTNAWAQTGGWEITQLTMMARSINHHTGLCGIRIGTKQHLKRTKWLVKQTLTYQVAIPKDMTSEQSRKISFAAISKHTSKY